MAENVMYIKGTTAEISGTAIVDGQLLWDETTGQTYIDVGSVRKPTGKLVDTALSTTSTNAIANNAITTSIVNTTAEVMAITNNYIPCGTKPVKELITSLNAMSVTEVVDIKNSSNISIGKMVKLGKLRILSVFSGANNNNADGTITTISDVPVAQLYSKSAYGAENTLGSFRVDIDGKIYLLSSSGAPIQSPYVTGNITFVVN